ncbi:hypothetical protein [Romboutsia weinsteinii]|nr:hypothetical protein [Romboutsia weinsteinii]
MDSELTLTDKLEVIRKELPEEYHALDIIVEILVRDIKRLYEEE